MKIVLNISISCLVLCGIGLPLAAQDLDPATIRGDSAQTRKRLAEAEQKLLAGKAVDAVEDLQRVLDEAGSDLITLDGKHFRPAPWFAQQILAKLPANVLKNYQDQVDSPARKLLDTAKRTRDPGPLWQLVDRYFVSRPTDEGLLLLGDLLFERGEFRTAELIWSRLLPGRNAELVYPNSQASPTLVWARIILAAIFQGELTRATTELAAFQKAHPDTRGAIAGKEGVLANILRDQLQNPPRFQNAANPGTDWPTFGGGPGHPGSVGAHLPAEWNNKPRVEHIIQLPNRSPRAPGFRHSAPLPFGHPVVAEGHVYVTNGYSLFWYNMATGRSDAETLPNAKPFSVAGDKAVSVPCPTLTVAGGRLYARVGPMIFNSSSPSSGKVEDSAIICYAIKKGPGDGLSKLWELKPPESEGKARSVWEGAPQVSGRRMWAAYSRIDGGRSVHGIACYDPADPESAPDRPAWSMEVCESPLTAAGENRTRQELVTVDGRMVFFCSNTGAVVALDANTGRRVWAFRYQRSLHANPNWSSDPAPAVACNGRLFVAPADAEHVYALDPETGELLWESENVNNAQILGVAANKVFVTVAGKVHGLRGLNVATGSYREPAGTISYNLNVVPGRGRGFVTENAIFWPSSSGLWLFNPKNGDVLLSPFCSPSGSQNSTFGNIVYADGMLFVVTETHLWIYLSEWKEFGPADRQSVSDPDWLRFKRFTTRAEEALADRKPALARKILLEAARSTLPAQYRAWTVARLVALSAQDHSAPDDDPRRLMTPDLRGEWVISAEGLPVTLETFLQGSPAKARQAAPGSPPQHASLLQVAVERPRLSLMGEIARTVHLPPGVVPLQPIPGANKPRHLYLRDDTQLISMSLNAGEETRHQADAAFTHAAETTEGFVAAGPFDVALYGADKAPLWKFRVPFTDPLPAADCEYRLFCNTPIAPPELSAFQISGNWLIARLGQHRLIAFDLAGRRVAWVLASDGRPGCRAASLPHPPRFGERYAISGSRITIQLSDARRWVVSLETGGLVVPNLWTRVRLWALAMLSPREAAPSPLSIASAEKTAQMWWITPPASLGGSTLVVADGAGLIRLHDAPTGEVHWTYDNPGREFSLRGESAQARIWGRHLLVAVSRNDGFELDRLDPVSGKSLWKDGVAFLDCDRLQLDDADAGPDLLFIPSGNTLIAIEWATGKVAWERELPHAHGTPGWVIHAGEKCLIVYPRQAIPHEPTETVWNRMVLSFQREPELGRLPIAALGLYDAWVARSFPVFVIDAKTGRQTGKVEIPALGPAATVCLNRDRVVVATGDRVCWLK